MDGLSDQTAAERRRYAAALVAAGGVLVEATEAETGVSVYSEAFQSPRHRLSRAAAQRSPQRTMTLSLRARFASQGMNFTSWAEVTARIQWLLVFFWTPQVQVNNGVAAMCQSPHC